MSAGAASLRLQPAETALVIVDVQARLSAAMERTSFDVATRNLLVLIAAAARLRLPVAVSEQYPEGLGATVPVLREALGRLPAPATAFSKLAFSAADEPVMQSFLGSGRKSLVVVGMETHICVYQTVRDLVARGYSVHVPADAVVSRTPSNHHIGLDLIARAGGIPSSTETVLFDLLGRAGTDDFRALAKLVR